MQHIFLSFAFEKIMICSILHWQVANVLVGRNVLDNGLLLAWRLEMTLVMTVTERIFDF